MALLKALSAEQSAFFKRQGYLKYDDHPIIGDDLLHALRQRSEAPRTSPSGG